VSSQLPVSEELTYVFARMTGVLLSEETVASALSLITTLAVETVEGACGAGVTLMAEDGRPVTSAGTDSIVQEADALQYALGEGPCLAAWQDRAVYRVDDLASDDRWPRWSRAAHGLGLGSALSAPLVAGDLGVGAIKVYARGTGAFGESHERVLSLFGAQAAILVANKQAYDRAGRLSDEMRATLKRRDVINQAKGVIMQRDSTTEEAAFSHLVSLAQRESRGVHDAASRVVDAASRRRG
jgi:GAF domain-containing protein